MILIYGVVGLLLGALLSWLADCMPDWAGQGQPLRTPRPRFRLAVWRYLRGSPLAPRVPSLNLAVESLTAILFAWLWTRPLSVQDRLGLSLITAFLILIAIVDYKYRLLPDVLVFPAAVALLVSRLVMPPLNAPAVLAGGAFGLVLFGGVAFLRPGTLGGGDVKLAALIGLLFGFPAVIWALMAGIFAGGIAAILLLFMSRGERASQMPYGPFLCLGVLVAFLYNPFLPFTSSLPGLK